ncbi:MAG: SDR family NAD(P)-dependent oxidoreductase [Flavobacteriaceae bacterium]
MGKDIKGQVVWVVGAAGTIGRSTAEALVAEGAKVIVSSRGIEDADPPIAGATAINVDARDAASIKAAAARIANEFGGLDGLVVSTTLPIFGDLLELADEDWEKVLDTKLIGSIRLTRAAAPEMIRKGRGSIVLISGLGGFNPSLTHIPGSIANAGINLFVKGAAKRLGPDNIRINAISPGAIRSPRLDAMQGKGSGIKTPMGGAGEPADIAETVMFLLSDRSKYITGSVISVDGGGLL